MCHVYHKMDHHGNPWDHCSLFEASCFEIRYYIHRDEVDRMIGDNYVVDTGS